MNQHPPVPRLDLAPKLKRPLSLWNPLDYLRLLYWVFFFPQALRWYMDTFGGGYIPEKEMSWQEKWELLRQNPIQRNLLIQGLVLTVVTPLTLAWLLQQIGVDINWYDVALGVALGVAYSVALGVAYSVALGVAGGVALGVAFGVALGVAFGVAFGVAILRPENWLFGLPLVLRSPHRQWQIPHVTPLPLYSLSSRLKNWLCQDWETGLHNANQLLAYTLQFIPVIQAVNLVLAETPPEQVVFRVVQLAEDPFDWQLVRFTSASLNETLKSTFVKDFFSFPLFFFLPRRWQEQLQALFFTDTRLDTPARATAAGFWYLHEKEPVKAVAAFAQVRSLPYGEEMFTLAQTLAAFNKANKPNTIATVKIPPFPQEPLLRPITWQTLTSLRSVVENAKIIQRSQSAYQRSLALNRALGELTEILNNADTLPQAERWLIIDIAQTWRYALEGIAKEVGEISITKPVSNPYIIGDPVVGDRFVGREDVIRQLQELWMRSSQLQSVVIYGHRRMGKTSILRNVASFVKAGVQVAYVNLLEVADAPQGVVEVLMAISDAISEVMQIPPPSNEDLLSLPQPTFRRYLTQVEAELGTQGLIIALDEFEKIEELMSAGKIPLDFMGYLRGLTQKSSKIAFVLAGLHTLEEMTADYFQPFYASVMTIKVGFMEAGATHQILANPSIEDFPLDYTPEALDKIYSLTHGQPYLVQLVAFQLVRRYNDEVFNTGRARDNNLTIGDVEAVVNDFEFFQRGRYYFDGVWGQAARGAAGQREILRALASPPQGLSITALYDCTNIEIAALQEALNTLKRHDVVEEIEGRWRIIVELFRRWVFQL
ncbi:AAA family ATPase [Brasilonema octagenarum]|uniref:ATP-binding protein n=1 Tax=Brasilonema octagenarum UFV-OR1 TaxID=417115 RepID=A0ABX1M4N8_9CYAN|nr:ATP-binding protein [Brasilonema octagenarum]NMF63500.1 ATP-binding protein [Brasilonema octagenarum UFV-OR1]